MLDLLEAFIASSLFYEILERGCLVPAFLLGYLREEGGSIIPSTDLEVDLDSMLAHLPVKGVTYLLKIAE